MVDHNQKKQDDNKNTVGSIVAGVAGGVAIAGVAVAATIALKDEKTRKKVGKVLTDVKDHAIDYVETLKTEPSIDKGKQVIKKSATATKKGDKQLVAGA